MVMKHVQNPVVLRIMVFNAGKKAIHTLITVAKQQGHHTRMIVHLLLVHTLLQRLTKQLHVLAEQHQKALATLKAHITTLVVQPVELINTIVHLQRQHLIHTTTQAQQQQKHVVNQVVLQQLQALAMLGLHIAIAVRQPIHQLLVVRATIPQELRM